MLNQETELQILEALLPAVAPTFIDVGAEKGNFSRWLIQRGLTGSALEPLPEHAQDLRKLAAGGRVHFLPCAADATDGERELHIATDANGRPLDFFHSLQPLTDDARVQHTKTVRVKCRSLGSLAKEGVLPGVVGFLKIDTEGNDLRVLEGMNPLKAQILMVEYFTEGIYAGWSDAAPQKLIARAESVGYTHCVAIRRSEDGLPERITYQPLSFQPREWGNLIFLADFSLAQIRSLLATLVAGNEQRPREQMELLQKCCDERAALIEYLHAEGAKRVSLIEELTRQLHPPTTS